MCGIWCHKDTTLWKVFLFQRVELRQIPCRDMAKGYKGLLLTLVSSHVELIPEAYPLGVLPVFS